MADFSSFQHCHPFLLDPLLLISPNTTSINAPNRKLSSVFINFDNNDPFRIEDYSPDQTALVNSSEEVVSQEDDSCAAKKQSCTTTGSSSSAAAVNRPRRKRNCSTNFKNESEGGKSKRRNKGKDEQKKKVSEEPPKDYIHVRARRGQATDSHSLAERVRREKISEKMRILQKLVPGCDKVTGKALMLDEIINYVQSLQNQVEFLSMKLTSMSPVVYDFGVDIDSFIVRPEMVYSEAMPTNTSLFPLLLDNHLLTPHHPFSQGINDEEQRQKFPKTSFCSSPSPNHMSHDTAC